jgi:hypothetical protein
MCGPRLAAGAAPCKPSCVRRRVELVWLISFFALACGPSADRDAEAPAASAVDTDHGEPSSERVGGEASAGEDPLLEGPPPLDETGGEARAGRTRSFDIEKWAAERGIEVKLDGVERCEAAQVGDKPDLTLWCWRDGTVRAGFETRLILLYVQRGQTLFKAFELAHAVSIEGEREKALVELSPRLEDDGKTVIFSESGASCDDALARADADHPDEPDARKAKRAAITDICRRRGRYRWMAGTLRRVGPP